MAAHRYWRLYIDANNGGGFVGIGELQFRTTIGTSLPFSGGTASASHASAFAANLASDANVATGWATSWVATTPEWWMYDYGAGVTIDIREVSITVSSQVNWFTYGPKNFYLQSSDDNSVWTTVGTYGTTWASDGQTQLFSGVGQPGTHVTQVSLEEWATNGQQVHGWTTQVALEVWGRGTAGTNVLTTQVSVETWGSVAFVPPGGGANAVRTMVMA